MMLVLATVAVTIDSLTTTSASSDASPLRSHGQHWALSGPLPSGIVSISGVRLRILTLLRRGARYHG
jgi:hypothetical protein